MARSTSPIQRYLEDRFLFEFDDEITGDTDLFKVGVIDSFGYIKLMKFLESEYAIKIDMEDVLKNVLVSLTAIEEFVDRKIAA
ncbi:phosphopantetheine-binding protein [Mycobacterium decipiens]|uniref:Acyl carrier protein n=1 Tax=Mycobacterium decipiens TaxID=1430326 RepID=A0A1X2LZX1_9MYCO|nr:phosphopantetheine-binding protein [Mycobacterium decipiens]OSC42267.1 acyl carrier protein [Mycobacterium decipiens]